MSKKYDVGSGNYDKEIDEFIQLFSEEQAMQHYVNTLQGKIDMLHKRMSEVQRSMSGNASQFALQKAMNILLNEKKGEPRLKYGEYHVDGWGGEGLYDETQVTGLTDHKLPVPIIPVDAIIAGYGPGWEDNGIFDEEILKELAELYNSAHFQKP